MFGLRCICVSCFFVFVALLPIVEYFPQIIIGSAGMVAAPCTVCSRNVLPGCDAALPPMRCGRDYYSGFLTRCRNRSSVKRKPAKAIFGKTIEFCRCRYEVRFWKVRRQTRRYLKLHGTT